MSQAFRSVYQLGHIGMLAAALAFAARPAHATGVIFSSPPRHTEQQSSTPGVGCPAALCFNGVITTPNQPPPHKVMVIVCPAGDCYIAPARPAWRLIEKAVPLDACEPEGGQVISMAPKRIVVRDARARVTHLLIFSLPAAGIGCIE